MTDKQKEKLRKLFLRLTRSKGFLSIEEIVARLDAGDFWTDDFMAHAIGEAKKSFARKMAREAKDKDGKRIFHNIEVTNSEGETTRGYMQETLFDVSHYKQVVAYHAQRATYHLSEARELQKACLERHGVQVELPFDEALPVQRAEKPKAKRKARTRKTPEAEA